MTLKLGGIHNYTQDYSDIAEVDSFTRNVTMAVATLHDVSVDARGLLCQALATGAVYEWQHGDESFAGWIQSLDFGTVQLSTSCIVLIGVCQ